MINSSFNESSTLDSTISYKKLQQNQVIPGELSLTSSPSTSSTKGKKSNGLKGTTTAFKKGYVLIHGNILDNFQQSFSTVEDVYGPAVKVQKLECIGHVQKRIGNRLRKLKKTTKGLGGKGRLTDAIVDKLQNYYGIAIRRNVGDLNEMRNSVYAAFWHVSASATKTDYHKYCPVGADSWCQYQVDKVHGTSKYKPGAGLPLDVIKHVKPIIEDLDSLLTKCLHGKTQNQNEAFNALIWRRIPKDTYVGFRQFEIGVCDAVAHFNIGNLATIQIMEKLGMDSGYYTVSGCSVGNTMRVSNAVRMSTEKRKLRRRLNRGIKKSKGDKHSQKEGKLYVAGEH